MSKIKQVLLMHRNGMSNRKIAEAVGLDKCTVNEYVRKIKADPLSLEALLRLEDPELEAHMFAGNPAYTDERMKDFLDKLPYFREQLEDKHVTRLLLWEEYRRENPDGYGKSQFFFHLKQNLVAQKQVGVLRVHSYDIDPHSYDVDPLEEGRAFKEQSLFACKQAAA